jgi:hypothetical protein
MENDHGPSEFDDRQVIERLRAFGTAPLADDVATAASARLPGREARVPGGRAKWIVAAAVAGFMAGSVGLATADVLPAPVQDVAHHALDAVGVHVPPGHQRFNDPATCPGGPYANHGAYVRTHHDDPNAGESPCGKPLKAVTPGHESENDGQPGEHGHGKGNGEGKGSHDQHPDKSSHPGEGNGNGNGNGHGHGQGTGGKPDDQAGTHDDEPATGGTPSTSMPAPTTTSTTSTTVAPATTTTSLPSTPTT